MKVYFAASITLSRDLLPVYQAIVSEIKTQGHQVLSEHVVDPKLKIADRADAEKIFAQETEKIERAELMVAEVTAPSWGTAFLMEQALDRSKPVLALYYKDAQEPLPLMIEGHPELYVAHYTLDNIKTVLKKNLEHFAHTDGRKGKLVVIDGTDGSGKATQTRKLLSYFAKQKIPYKYIDFPRYYTSFHGKMVGRFLAGEFGSRDTANPYLASLTYAMDRLTARDELVDWLDEGDIIIANRYTTSNFAFQGARVPKEEGEVFEMALQYGIQRTQVAKGGCGSLFIPSC